MSAILGHAACELKEMTVALHPQVFKYIWGDAAASQPQVHIALRI